MMQSRDSVLPETNTPAIKLLLEMLNDPAAITTGSEIIWVNEAFTSLFGYECTDDMTGLPVEELITPEDRSKVMARSLGRLKGEVHPELYEFQIRRRDGTGRSVLTRAALVTYAGKPSVLVVMRDITDRQIAQERLSQSLSLQRATLESTADGILAISLSGEVIDYNRRFQDMWRLPDNFPDLLRADRLEYRRLLADQLMNPELLPDRNHLVLSAPETGYHDTFYFKDGRIIERHGLPQRLGDEVVGIVWNMRDVTEQRNLEKLLLHQANHDALTDLLNRRGLQVAMQELLERTTRIGRTGALFLLDLDQFKEINDTLGHPAGDEVLSQVGLLLKEHLQETAAIARLGGDEFAIIFEQAGPLTARRLGLRLLDLLRGHSFSLSGGERVEVTASIGAVLFPGHGNTVEELMSRVDIALYGAKDRGRNRIEVYATRDETQTSLRDRLYLRQQLSQALQQDALHLLAQPIVSLASGRTAGHELLLRMRRSDGTLIGASRIIDVAERSGQILEIDRWVTARAMELLASLQARGEPSSIEVNLSSKSLDDRDLISIVRDGIQKHYLDPQALVFEVTETAAISNLQAAKRFMMGLRDLGCRFALDDFGVGFSSLTHLQTLPVDFLKIDGSFISGIAGNSQSRELVRGIITIARALNIQTIAESVGSQEEVDVLRELGADFVQGYWIGRPRDAQRVLGAEVEAA